MGLEELYARFDRRILRLTNGVEKRRIKAIGEPVESHLFKDWLYLRLRLDGMLEARRILSGEDTED